MPKVHLRTYGCQMNERDSEQVARMFIEGGYTVTDNEREADAILINTCSVRDQAEQKADRKSTRLNSSHAHISYAVFCLKKRQSDAGKREKSALGERASVIDG